MRILLALSAAALMSTAAQAVTVVNGSFENGTFTNAPFNTLGAGNTSITGWTIGGVGIDWIGTHWQPAAGARSIDLNALGAGSLSQAVTTEIGKSYLVSFALAGNPEGTPTDKTINVSINGGAATPFAFSTVGRSRSNMGWVNHDYRFLATSTSSVLRFASPLAGASGPALDNVSISVVPEASTWAMLIAGFGMVGAAARRRRNVVAA